MEIKEIGGELQIHFLEKKLHMFSPALTAYSIKDPWQMLEGNAYLAHLQEGPDSVQWYRLKMIADINTDHPTIPIWPQDKKLDDVMKFVPTNGHITKVSYLTLPRVTQDQHHHLLRNTEYSQQTEGPVSVDDWYIPLEGFWGRATGLAVSGDSLKPSVVVPHAQVYRLSLRVRRTE